MRVDHYYGARPLNTSSYYTVLSNYPSTGYWEFDVDQVAYLTTNAISFTSNEAQVMGETHTRSDQMPGQSSQHATFYDTNAYYAGVWHAFSGVGVNYNSSYYTLYGLSTYNFEEKDNAC
jgi:hypothetical protein